LKKVELKGKGLFVFSDPGGAKPCLSYIILNKISNYIVISDREYSFYSDFNINVIITKKIEKYIYEFNPDYIFTATSYTSNIEKDAIIIAKRKKIPIVTYIDHSTNIFERFDNGNQIVLPSTILVSDNDTLDQLKNFTIFNTCDIIKIKNPYHTFLSNWKPNLSKEVFFENLKIPINKKIILIAFDPISNINGIQKYGFDEITGINELNQIIFSHDSLYTFIYKPHPNQNIDLLKGALNNKAILVPSQTDTINLIYFSDIIIGFFSNLLLEADVFNKKIIRYRPAGFKNDPFHKKKLGVIADKKTIINYI
jgi:hypothetical protein